MNQTSKPTDAQFKAMRDHMIESQLRTSDVNDLAVIAAFAKVSREKYVPAERASTAYMDRAIPLGEGRSINPPLSIGRLIIAAELRRTDRVLLIGAATGYTADLLSHLVAEVVAVEERSSLLDVARANLADKTNITLVEAPLVDGMPPLATFDVIIFDGAIEQLPSNLVNQVKDGGRIVTGLNERGVTRLARGIRVGEHASFVPFADMEAVTLPGFDKPKAFTF